MSKEKDSLTLKWGTLKAWTISSEAMKAAAEKADELKWSGSAMAQVMTPDHKAAVCAMIDAVEDGGVIKNDWTGELMSKDEAKKYIMEYR